MRFRLRLSTRMPSPKSVLSVDRKSTRLNSSHSQISYAVFCLKKKNRHRRYVTNVTESYYSIYYTPVVFSVIGSLCSRSLKRYGIKSYHLQPYLVEILQCQERS